MTFERRIVVGFEDIKAVCLQCKNCGFRMSLPPDSITNIPFSCEHCEAEWRSSGPTVPRSVEPVFLALVKAIGKVRASIENEDPGFRILLEFEEPTERT